MAGLSSDIQQGFLMLVGAVSSEGGWLWAAEQGQPASVQEGSDRFVLPHRSQLQRVTTLRPFRKCSVM